MNWTIITAAGGLLFCVSCTGEREKQEWGVLQTVASAEDALPVIQGKVVQQQRYYVVSYKGMNVSKIWILMNPQTAPYYKQMPPDANFTVSKKELELLKGDSRCDKTVYSAIRAHSEGESK